MTRDQVETLMLRAFPRRHPVLVWEDASRMMYHLDPDDSRYKYEGLGLEFRKGKVVSKSYTTDYTD